jgi:DNA-binding CsgD family transcriptional regulator
MPDLTCDTTTALPNAMLGPLLDEIDYGLMLLDAEGVRVLVANRAARLECAAGRALRLDGERLLAAHPGDAAPLAIAVLDAARGRRSLIALGGDEEPLTLAAVPVALTGTRHSALLIIGRRQLCETLSVDMFARRHGLTSAESHVLRALCDGLAPAGIAAQSGVSVSTVRTQVAAIRSKTAAGSIRELVRRVAALPPIVPALRNEPRAHALAA